MKPRQGPNPPTLSFLEVLPLGLFPAAWAGSTERVPHSRAFLRTAAEMLKGSSPPSTWDYVILPQAGALSSGLGFLSSCAFLPLRTSAVPPQGVSATLGRTQLPQGSKILL